MLTLSGCNNVARLACWAAAGLSWAAFAAAPPEPADLPAVPSQATPSAAVPGAGASAAAVASSAVPGGPGRMPPPVALRGSRLLSADALASRRGGTALASDMQLSGVVTDNRVSDASTGSNLVTQGAFAGAAGLPVVIQNSGNNVLIQNATIVNLQLR